MAKKGTQTKADASTVLFKILADKNRARALALLMRARGGLGVGGIAKTLGMSNSAASHLLAMLYENNVVSYEKTGREVIYTLAVSARAKALVRILRVV